MATGPTARPAVGGHVDLAHDAPHQTGQQCGDRQVVAGLEGVLEDLGVAGREGGEGQRGGQGRAQVPERRGDGGGEQRTHDAPDDSQRGGRGAERAPRHDRPQDQVPERRLDVQVPGGGDGIGAERLGAARPANRPGSPAASTADRSRSAARTPHPDAGGQAGRAAQPLRHPRRPNDDVVADLPQAQPVGGATAPRPTGRGPPGCRPSWPGRSDRGRRRRACRRSSGPSGGRTRCRGSRTAAARRSRRARTSVAARTRRTSDGSGSSVGAPSGRRQNDEKSCSPISGSQAELHRPQVERLGDVPGSVRPSSGFGDGRVPDVVAVVPPRRREPGVEVRRRAHSRGAHGDAGPHSWLSRRARAARSVAAGRSPRHDLAPGVHAGVGAPGAGELDRAGATHRGDRRGERRPCTVRTPAFGGEPVEPAPVVGHDETSPPRCRTGSILDVVRRLDAATGRCDELRPVRCAPSGRCRPGAGRA